MISLYLILNFGLYGLIPRAIAFSRAFVSIFHWQTTMVGFRFLTGLRDLRLLEDSSGPTAFGRLLFPQERIIHSIFSALVVISAAPGYDYRVEVISGGL